MDTKRINELVRTPFSVAELEASEYGAVELSVKRQDTSPHYQFNANFRVHWLYDVSLDGLIAFANGEANRTVANWRRAHAPHSLLVQLDKDSEMWMRASHTMVRSARTGKLTIETEDDAHAVISRMTPEQRALMLAALSAQK